MLPAVGAKPVRMVTEHDVRGVLRALVARGVNRTAVEVHRNIKQMFRWAEKRQPWRRLLQDGNPAELVEIAKIVEADYDLSKIRSRVLNDDEVRELRDRFEQMAREYDARRPTSAVPCAPSSPRPRPRCGCACPRCAASASC